METYDHSEQPIEQPRGLEALIPTKPAPRPVREPETVAQALADVHRRYCPTEEQPRNPANAHDPVCRILTDALTIRPDEVKRAHEGIARRLEWASLHWRTERVSPEAWPHIAGAAAAAVLPAARRARDEALERVRTVTAERDDLRDRLDALETARRRSRRPLTDGKAGGQRHAPDTAKTAAELVAPRAGTQRAKILAEFRVWGDVTDFEIGRLTLLPLNSVRPRRVELVDAGWLEPAGTRKHNGREHTTWRLTAAARERLEA